jgi:amphi-Trp domain-containing protein
MRKSNDAEKSYSNKESIAKLRRLAEALEKGEPYEIQIAGKRIYVPADATVSFEFEQEGDEMELDIEVKWGRNQELSRSTGSRIRILFDPIDLLVPSCSEFRRHVFGNRFRQMLADDERVSSVVHPPN